jgi:hypothetical protein
MKPYQALIWNEWRQIRGNVLALAGVTVLLWLMLLLGSYNKEWASYIEMIAIALALGLPLLYSIVLADSFAREFSQKTDSFLLELPVRPTKIFFCKYLANLLPFLGLAAFETLLMLRLTRLTGGKHFTDDLQHWGWITVIAIIAATWLCAHAMVFLASLISRRSGNSIISIIIMPLPVVLLLPGTMAITMFFTRVYDYLSWIIASFLLALTILYCFCIWFGAYLWACRIVCGRRILKPVIVAFALTLIAPWIFYGAAYLYVNMSFNSAIREARAAGLETDINKLIPTPVPVEQNAAPRILKFCKEYRRAEAFFKSPESSRKLPELLPSRRSWDNTNFNYALGKDGVRENIPQEEILEATDFIMKDPRMNQCYSILSEALKKPYCRFGRDYTNMEHHDAWSASYNTCKFLSDRAYAFRVSGNDDGFFECLVGIDKIANALSEQQSKYLKERELDSRRNEYEIAIAAGPDTRNSVDYYKKMLCDIDSINLVMPDETFRIYGYLKGEDRLFYFGIPSMSNDFIRGFRLFYLPRQLQIAAAWTRRNIQANKLIEQALAGARRKEMEAELKSLRKDGARIPDSYYEDVYPYFRYRNLFTSYKICLSLKIYHIQYGKFPDSLQQLVPEILPKIPVNPETGKEYTYQPKDDGFLLLSSENYGIKYQTWKIGTEEAK